MLDFSSPVTKMNKNFVCKKKCKIDIFILIENLAGLVYSVLLSYRSRIYLLA